MLETIREFAGNELDREGHRRSAQARHVAYFVRVASEAEAELLGPSQSDWLSLLERDHDNLRAALAYCLEVGLHTQMHTLVGALWWFWTVHGHLLEGTKWAELALAEAPVGDTTLRARTLFTSGTLALWMGDGPRAGTILNESLATFTATGDVQGRGRCLNWLACVDLDAGDLAAGQRGLDEAAACAEKAGDRTLAMWVSANRYMVAIGSNDLDGARRIARSTLKTAEELNDRQSVALSFGVLGWLAFLNHDDREAMKQAKQARTLFVELADATGLVMTAIVLAGIAVREKDLATARTLLVESIGELSSVGLDIVAQWLCVGAIYAAVANGPSNAALLFGAADSIRHESGAQPSPPVAACWAEWQEVVRSQLGAKIYKIELGAGQQLRDDRRLAAAAAVLNNA